MGGLKVGRRDEGEAGLWLSFGFSFERSGLSSHLRVYILVLGQRRKGRGRPGPVRGFYPRDSNTCATHSPSPPSIPAPSNRCPHPSIHLSVHPCTHSSSIHPLSIHPSIHPFSHLPIHYPCIHLSILLSIHSSFYPSIHSCAHSLSSLHLPIIHHPLIHQSTYHPSKRPPTLCPSACPPSLHPPTCLQSTGHSRMGIKAECPWDTWLRPSSCLVDT